MNNQNSKEVSQIDTNSTSDENVKLLLIFIFALPLLLVSSVTKSRSGNYKIWKVGYIQRKKYLLSFLVLPFWLILEFLFLKELFQMNFKMSIVLWALANCVGLGFSLIVIRHTLSSLADDFFLNRLDPHKYIYTKLAIFKSGLANAQQVFQSRDKLIPKVDPYGRPLIGVLANAKDFRSRTLRKKYKELNLLESYISGDYVIAPLNKEDPIHQLVVADTGVGKTRLLSRMALCGINEKWKVVIVDFKGARDEKLLYSSLGKFAENKNLNVKVFPDENFNIFRGTNEDITQKLISFLPPLTGTPADFYTKRMMRGLEAVINNDLLPPPQDPYEVIHRVKNGTLFAKEQNEKLWFSSKDKGQLISDILEADISQCFLPLTNKGQGKLHLGNTWSDNWDLMMFSLDGNQRNDVLIGEAILMDFDNHLRKSERHKEARNYLLIIDEAGVLNSIGGSKALPSLISRSRSAGVGVILASQSLLSLGNTADEIAQTTPMRWIGRMANPQSMVDLVGTSDVIEGNYSSINGNWTSSVSGKIQKSYIVDPDKIRQLPKFYWNLSIGGEHLWVYEPPL